MFCYIACQAENTNASTMTARTQTSARAGQPSREEGLTLVEAAIALGVLSLLCAGVMLVSLHARRFAEHSRVATEAQALAKERLEDMLAIGCERLRETTWNADTNRSSLGQQIIRQPRIVWHTGDKAVSGASTSLYAEVHIDMIFPTPLVKSPITNTFSMIIQ